MASKQDIQAGKAYVRLYLKNDMTRQLRRTLRSAGDHLKTLGRGMMAAGIAAAVPFAFATRTLVRFEDQMLTVKAVTGAVGDEFDKLNAKAKLLGRTTSFTAGEVAGGMVELGRAGFKPAEIDDSIASILSLARATGTELPKAAEIAAGTLRAFNLEADQMDRVSDVMAATANNSAQTLEQLGDSMTYAAPIAEEYGLTLEETTKALGVMANMQIKGSMAGTSMRMMLLQLSDPAIREQLKEMGVDLSNFGDTMLGVGKVMGDMSGPERLAFAKGIFGQRAAGGALKLTKGGFDDLSNAIDNAAGSAAKASAEMDSGLGGAFRILKSAAEGVQIAVGEALAPTLRKIAEWMTKTAGATVQWVSENRELVVTIAKVTAAVIAAGAAFYVLGTAMTVIVAHPLILTLTVLGAALVHLAGGFDNLFTATKKYKDVAGEALMAGDKQRRAAQGQLDELLALARQQSLTTAEQELANRIIGDLTSTYGDLGTQVDSVTGKLEGLGRAQDRINEAMRQNALLELRQAEQSALSQVEASRDRQRQIMSGERSVASVAWGFSFGGDAARMEAEGEKQGKLQTQLRVLRGRIEQLRSGESGGALSGVGEVQAAGAGGAAGAAERDPGLRAALRAEIQLIENHESRALAAERVSHNQRKEQAIEAGGNLALVEREYQANLTRIRRDGEQGRATAAQRDNDRRLVAEQSLQDSIARLEIEATKEGRKKELAFLNLARKQAMRDARESGADLELVEKQFALRRKSLDRHAASPSQASRGPTLTATYSARAASIAGFQAGGPEDKMVAGIDAVDKSVTKVLHKLIEGVVSLDQFLAGMRVP